ncbi:MAG: VanZ family protein [Candidatus Aminicenantes bacterium]|nr:MAG: VanZ family protein [Candidatus Aminicenantes bacterium]
MTLKKKIFISWLLVILCILSIFLIVPIARTIRNFVETNWNVSLFGYSVLLVVVCAFLYCLCLLWLRLKIRAFSNYLWLAAIALFYVFFTLKLWKRPEEAIHFLEYGLLGFLLFQALRHHIHDKGIYFIAFLIGALVGIFDETLQWMIPRRVWDFRDLGINAIAVGLCLVAIWKGIRPKLPGITSQSRSIRIISYLLITYLVLFGLCFSNTPDRVQSYTKILPFLSFLQKEEPMNEFKYKHRDPEIGVFFSRLSLEKLASTDNQRAEEYGAIFKEWISKKYGDFLISFPGYGQPFLHEMRVHIFRRDKRLSLAFKADNQKEREENLFISYKENLILEKYFGKTLQKSPHKWPTTRSKKIEAEIETTPFYRSPVSASTDIPFNEKALWGIILLIISALVLGNIGISRKQKSP